jgi:hypothetical protein
VSYADPEKNRAYQREYQRKWRAANREKVRRFVRDSKLREKYDLEPEEFDAMLTGQRGGCAICGATEAGGRGAFHVDHDHATGKVRGLLCHHCNVGIGSLRDSPETMRAAAAYVEKHREAA